MTIKYTTQILLLSLWLAERGSGGPSGGHCCSFWLLNTFSVHDYDYYLNPGFSANPTASSVLFNMVVPYYVMNEVVNGTKCLGMRLNNLIRI